MNMTRDDFFRSQPVQHVRTGEVAGFIQPMLLDRISHLPHKPDLPPPGLAASDSPRDLDI